MTGAGPELPPGVHVPQPERIYFPDDVVKSTLSNTKIGDLTCPQFIDLMRANMRQVVREEMKPLVEALKQKGLTL